MQSRLVTRRFMMMALGSGAALAPVIARGATSGTASRGPAPSGATEPPTTPEWGPTHTPSPLFRGLSSGSVVAGCTVLGIGDLVNGAVGIALRDRAGTRFGVEVCARDASAPRGPGETQHFSLYVVNEGDGAMPTYEEHGLAAMAIADVVRRNESGADVRDFLTLDERLARHAATIIRPD